MLWIGTVTTVHSRIEACWAADLFDVELQRLQGIAAIQQTPQGAARGRQVSRHHLGQRWHGCR